MSDPSGALKLMRKILSARQGLQLNGSSLVAGSRVGGRSTGGKLASGLRRGTLKQKGANGEKVGYYSLNHGKKYRYRYIVGDAASRQRAKMRAMSGRMPRAVKKRKTVKKRKVAAKAKKPGMKKKKRAGSLLE